MASTLPQELRAEPHFSETPVPHLANAARLRSISVEQLAWIVLLLAAIATRFWNLEYRALHHDESIHTYYSWFFSTGQTPYVHNPLSHGPFLFHINALVYLLVGGTDATSRFAPALTGVLLVGAPWLLRAPRFLGRWGALAAGFMLLISPAFLYYTRYIRHDPYTCLGAIALLIAIFRYIERPQRRWLFLTFASVAFMLTNHEIVFAIVLVFLGVLFVRLLIGKLRPVVPIVLALAGAGVLLLLARRLMNWPPLPTIPWSNPTSAQQSAYYKDLLSNPFILGIIVLGVLFVAGIVMGMRQSVPVKQRRQGYVQAIFGDSTPGTLDYAIGRMLGDPVALGISIVSAVFIFFLFFTTLFTNLDGIATGTYSTDGTLLYWLGQHKERRGNQPWFYFITESFQYEWLAIFFCTAACLWIGWRVFNALRRRQADNRLLFQVFLVTWFGFLFAVLSWAGEKMPWLIMHFTLPAILVGAVLINELIEGAITWYRESDSSLTERFRGAGPLLTLALVLIAGAWFFEAARLTYGNPVAPATANGYRPLQTWALNEWWLLAAFPALALAILIGAGVVLGLRRTAYVTITAAFIVMTLFQVHAGFRLSYLQGDVAIDTLIYNTTTPDFKQMDKDLTELSLMANGDNSLAIGYDGCSAWPLTWYFRDNPGAYSLNQVSVDNPSSLPPVVISTLR